MSDRLYLSLWLDGQSPLLLRHRFAKILGGFPFSKLAPGIDVTVRAVSNAEAALLEQSFAGPEQLADLTAALDVWQSPDTSFEVEASWDLMVKTGDDWRLSPVRVSLIAYGPEFERERGEDFRIEFGREAHFLPEGESPVSFRVIQGNIASLLRLVKDLDQTLAVKKRLLWSESGENFAERLAALAAST